MCSQYSRKAMVLTIVCFIFCKWIAMIFTIMSYENAEQANELWIVGKNDLAQQKELDAQKNYKLGAWIAIICFVLEVIISTVAVIGMMLLFTI